MTMLPITTFLAAFLLLPGFTSAQEETIGEKEFRRNCAACHGPEGRGDGPLAEWLKQAPPSLTEISKNNNGLFPFQEIYQAIDGTTGTGAHGTSAMPIWGDRYTAETFDQVGPYGGEEIVRGRILELVFYLQTIQE